MDVLGFSGLNDSASFKRREFPELDARYDRICQGFDAAAAIVGEAGTIAAAAEERFVRDKATGAFPVNAIRYCLDAAKAPIEALELVAHGFDYRPYRELYEQDELTRRQYEQVYRPDNQIALLNEHFPEVRDWERRLMPVPHHLAHAASAFYPSGFDEALVLVADGMGEQEGLTLARGSGEDITILKQIPAINSLGILYSVFTLYLGFEVNMDEYKVMGLAPYGNPRRHFSRVMGLVNLHDDGTHTVPLLFENATPVDRETHGGSVAKLTELFGPPREPKSEITRDHRDIAAALQATLQTTLVHLLKVYRKETGASRLVCAGGVALNCTANGVIKRSGLFEEGFVQPAAGDDGTALGAALYARRQRGRTVGGTKMGMPFWGPGIDARRIEAALADKRGLHAVRHEEESALLGEIAERLAAGQIVGWCQGRMEFGPRALGGRSIIADPRVPDMRDRINALVKKREDFRPFAPAVTAEDAATYFDVAPGDTALFEYMLCVTSVRPEHRETLPAITHVDGSARVQTVGERDNGRFWRLLRAFEARSGLPMVLNTSFNVMGQPVVCTEREAVDTFETAGLDVLAIGDYVVSRER